LRVLEGHIPGPDLRGEVVFDDVFLFEVPFVESDVIGTALRPDVAHTVGTSQFEGHEVIQFADLVLAGVNLRP
jgi:hypothetical protein